MNNIKRRVREKGKIILRFLDGRESHFSSLLVEEMRGGPKAKLVCRCRRRWGSSVEHKRTGRTSGKKRAPREKRRGLEKRCEREREREHERANRPRLSWIVRRAEGSEDRINYYYNEFHITIGVVKLRMMRVDPGSWVVHVQHGVRLASALRAVAQG